MNNSQLIRWFLAAWASVLAVFASGCGDDVCTRVCPSPQVCVVEAGQELCLEPNCGQQVCSATEECVNETCQRVAVECTGCTTSQHCVSGICVDDYTDANVCDPLRACREACGTTASCLAACSADQSAACGTCLSSLDSCQRREDCTDSGPYTECCETEFCSCFPEAPGCGTAACIECQEECGSDTQCFNGCRATTLTCNQCLQPFDACAASDGAAECVPEFCACLDPGLEADCR